MNTPSNIRELLRLAQDAADSGDWESVETAGAVLSRAARVMRQMEIDDTHNRWSGGQPFSLEWAAKIVYAGIPTEAA